MIILIVEKLNINLPGKDFPSSNHFQLWGQTIRRQSSEPSYPNFRVRMIFRVAFEVYPFFNHDCYTFISGISIIFVVRQTLVLTLTSNVWCFHRIVLLRNMREISRELHVCFFRSAKTVLISPRYDGLVDCRYSARSQANCRITKITRNVNVPWYDSLVNARTVHAARGGGGGHLRYGRW